MTEFASLIILAIVVEFVWEILGNIWKDKEINLNLVGSLILGLVIAFSTDLNLFEMIDIPMRFHVVGIIVSGVVISSGSNVVHEFINKLGGRE